MVKVSILGSTGTIGKNVAFTLAKEETVDEAKEKLDEILETHKYDKETTTKILNFSNILRLKVM